MTQSTSKGPSVCNKNADSRNALDQQDQDICHCEILQDHYGDFLVVKEIWISECVEDERITKDTEEYFKCVVDCDHVPGDEGEREGGVEI